jgi:hypothetical protein
MTRHQVESAIACGAPFTLRMADGKEYAVPHRDYIWLPPGASEEPGEVTRAPGASSTLNKTQRMQPKITFNDAWESIPLAFVDDVIDFFNRSLQPAHPLRSFKLFPIA